MLTDRDKSNAEKPAIGRLIFATDVVTMDTHSVLPGALAISTIERHSALEGKA